jgi:hypothetical protein
MTCVYITVYRTRSKEVVATHLAVYTLNNSLFVKLLYKPFWSNLIQLRLYAGPFKCHWAM